MAGNVENDCCFQWDETSQLYYHASCGFYHDPNAGWYYSTRDGLYYKFENGSYKLLEPNKGYELDAPKCIGTSPDEPNLEQKEFSNDEIPEIPPPPSTWLEDTLIDLYLSGYSNVGTDVAEEMPLTTRENDNNELSANGNVLSDELEEGELNPEECSALTKSSEHAIDEGASQEEENWLAQYGQVIQSEERPEFSVVDLWDWTKVTECKKNRKVQVSRLIGRLVKRSAKLHQSMPSSGGFLKTAPICEVRLDLVRVSTGKVYKLRCPNAKYLASLPAYDSSNPTKDWGFPDLSTEEKSNGNNEIKTASEMPVNKDLLMSTNQVVAPAKHRTGAYRDRAAERRTLHGGFGIGPGQKISTVYDDGLPESPDASSTEEAAAEALNMSFGTGSYARKILESMGWKEGEALGSSTKGIVEPIQAVGNIGSAGLGWPQGRAKPS